MSKTLKDIARELGVSVATVSRVVNGKDNVNIETKKKIEAYLAQHKYTPNQIARSLKENATRTIGFILPDICEVFFGHIIKGIDAEVSKEGYSIILADSNEDPQSERRYLELLSRQRVDGLVIATVDTQGDKVLEYMATNIPVIFIDNLPSLSVPFDAVLIDNVMASKCAVNHLLERGHRRIATIVGEMDETTGFDRLAGYRQAMEAAGEPVDEGLIAYGDYKEQSGYDRMMDLLRNREQCPFTAVYITAEMMTFGAVKAIRDSGLRIPEDIALVGFDVHDKGGLAATGITTIRQNERKVGKLVGELMLKRLREKQEGLESSDRQKILLMPYLEEKESSGNPHP